MHVCRFVIDYLEHCTILYKVDRYIDPIECKWQLPYNYKRRTNIVISDMDTINTCDRPLVKLLRSYCWEWDYQSIIFEKFQVKFIKINRFIIFIFYRLLLHILFWMHLLIYL